MRNLVWLYSALLFFRLQNYFFVSKHCSSGMKRRVIRREPNISEAICPFHLQGRRAGQRGNQQLTEVWGKLISAYSSTMKMEAMFLWSAGFALNYYNREGHAVHNHLKSSIFLQVASSRFAKRFVGPTSINLSLSIEVGWARAYGVGIDVHNFSQRL